MLCILYSNQYELELGSHFGQLLARRQLINCVWKFGRCRRCDLSNLLERDMIWATSSGLAVDPPISKIYIFSPFFLLMSRNASAPREARSAAPNTPPTAPPTIVDLSSWHVLSLPFANLFAHTWGVEVDIASLPPVLVAVAVVELAVAAATKDPIVYVTTLPQQLSLLPKGRQQYWLPGAHWRTLYAVAGPPPLRLARRRKKIRHVSWHGHL